MSATQAIDEDVVRERLSRELPRWSYSNGAIRRTFHTFGWKGALMAANAVGHIAEAAWHHPDLHISYSAVEVALSSHDAKGITDRDFALAAQIDSLLDWRPPPGHPLQGTPNDERFGYIKHER